MYCKCWIPVEANGKTCERCGGLKPTRESLQDHSNDVMLLDSITKRSDPERHKRLLNSYYDFRRKFF